MASVVHVVASWRRGVTVPLSSRMPASALTSRALAGLVALPREVSSLTAPALASVACTGRRLHPLPADRAMPMRTAPGALRERAGGFVHVGVDAPPVPLSRTHEVAVVGSTNFREGFDYAPTVGRGSRARQPLSAASTARR